MGHFLLENFTAIIMIGLLGGIFSLDGLAWGQFMIGRPIVVAPLLGWMLGDVFFGLTVGALLELLSAHYLPIGSTVSPDFSLAAILTTASPLLAFPPGMSGQYLLWALLLSLIAAVISMKAEIYIRQINIGLVHRAEMLVRKNSFAPAINLNLWGLGFFALRGFLFTIIFLVICVLLLRGVSPHLPVYLQWGRSMVKPLLMALGVAVVVELSAEQRALWILGVSFTLGLVCLWLNWLSPMGLLAVFFIAATCYLFFPGGIKFVRQMAKKT